MNNDTQDRAQKARQEDEIGVWLQQQTQSEEFREAKRMVAEGSHPTDEMLYDYVLDWLEEDEAGIIRKHLLFCERCAGEVLEIRAGEAELVEQISNEGFRQGKPFRKLGQTRETEATREDVLQQYSAAPLPVFSVFDGEKQNVSDYYHEIPLTDKLAASGARSGALNLPFTVEYADGRVIGEFQRRAGYLFFRLEKSAIGTCILVYTSKTDPSDVRTFDFQEGEDKRIGLFRELVSSNTIQGMLEAIKQFRLIPKQNP